MADQRRLFRGAVTSALLAVLPCASAQAAGWVTGPPLSPAGRVARAPMVALTPSGARIVAWEQLQTGSSNIEGIGVRIAAPGADFGPEQLLPDPSEHDPSLTTGADGTAALVWGSRGAVHLARLTPGQSTFTELTPVAASVTGAPALAVQDGAIYVAFGTRDTPGTLVNSSIEAVRFAAGANAAQLLPGTGTAGALDSASFDTTTQPSVVVDKPGIAVAAGVVHVVWEELDAAHMGQTTSATTVKRATRPVAGGTFTAPIPVSTSSITFSSAEPSTPRIAVGGGRVEIAWVRAGELQIGYQDLTGGAPVQTIPLGAFAENLRAGIDSTGALLLCWSQGLIGELVDAVFAASVPPGGTAGAPVRLTAPNANRALDDFVVGPDGSALALPDLVTGFFATDERVQASFRSVGGTFGGIEEVSGAQDRTDNAAAAKAAGAIGADGRTLAAWSAYDGSDVTNSRIFVSERDATAPSIGSLAIPSTAVTGTPVTLAAAATDALSPPVTIGWDFGDGAGAAGGSVQHTYGAPGNYTITVTAADRAGNLSTQTRTLAVATPADRTAPVIAGLRSSHPRFSVGGAAFALIAAKRRTPSGTVFTLGVSERATLVLSFTGKLAGRRAGKRCVAGRNRGRRCTVAVAPGIAVRAGRGPGVVSIPFSGRVGATRLLPGSYVMSVSAIDAAGNRSRPQTVAFTAVSR